MWTTSCDANDELPLRRDDRARRPKRRRCRNGRCLFAPRRRAGGGALQQATAMAQSRVPGRVVRAETVQMGDRVVHEIRILAEGGRTVRTVRIDAQTGAFL